MRGSPGEDTRRFNDIEFETKLREFGRNTFALADKANENATAVRPPML